MQSNAKTKTNSFPHYKMLITFFDFTVNTYRYINDLAEVITWEGNNFN